MDPDTPRALPVWAALSLLVLLVLVGACGAGRGSSTQGHDAPAKEIIVAAASDLHPAFEELGREFTAATGTEVAFSFGSSGQLREQIVNGAPFDLFASANVEFVDAVIEAGHGRAETKADYARGQLALTIGPGVDLPANVEDLADPAYRRIAIANPTHAPYGLAARQVLENAGIYDEVEDRLVYGENVSDTRRIARSGNADAALVALSLVVADPGINYEVVPADLHEPLRQTLVVTSTGARGETAQAFAELVSSPTGHEVMARYGFEPMPAVPAEG